MDTDGDGVADVAMNTIQLSDVLVESMQNNPVPICGETPEFAITKGADSELVKGQASFDVDCSDLEAGEMVDVKVWAWIENNAGDLLADYCMVTVVLQDNSGACSGDAE